MKQIVVENVKEGPKIIETHIPKVGSKDVLVRIVCSPLTGFDKVLGDMGVFPPPYVLGGEASGIVVEVGSGVTKDVIGKKVHITMEYPESRIGSWHGTWSEYVIAAYEGIFEYDQRLTHEEACGLYGNPATALGICNVINETTGGIFIIPGSTPISRILTNLLKKQGRLVISLARSSEEYIKLYPDLNEYVLDTSHNSFFNVLEHIMKSHTMKVLVDFLADDTTNEIFKRMREESLHLICGTLSGNKTIAIGTSSLINTEKEVKGYCLDYKRFLNPKEEMKKHLKMVSEDLVEGGKVFGVPIVKQYLMKDFKKALLEQPIHGQSGRMIINFK